jgi:hypothetical protein
MAMDQLIQITDDEGVSLTIIPISLNLDKKIRLIHVFEENMSSNKKYIRNELILVDNQILTSTFSDTVHFMEELSLFDTGNDQNKYLAVAERQKIKNLKLKNVNDNIFVSKSEARAIYRLFNMALMGYSLSVVLEKEFRFTPSNLGEILNELNIFKKAF